MALKEYRQKRDFRKTPEPAGKTQPRKDQLQFVVQKHAARRLHYDFRLELDGVLKSWAVPKGPIADPQVKSLAVEVEDHPLDYAGFEGIIPQGQYGGGTVMVWDCGTWEPEGDPAKALAAGKLSFELHGEKLRGAWTLVRMSGRGREREKRTNWLLIKRTDEFVRPASVFERAEQRAKSVISGRTMQQIASAADRVWQSNREAAPAANNGRPKVKKRKPAPPRKSAKGPASVDVSSLPAARSAKGELPAMLRPQLATLVDAVPEGDRWLHELKFDGYRILASIEKQRVVLRTRKGNDWTDRFPTAAKAIASLNLDRTILDGEIVALDEQGGSDFQKLQNWMKRGDEESLIYYVFDVPFLAGHDLRSAPLIERKKVLQGLLHAANPNNDGPLRLSEHVHGHGEQVLEFACRSAMEGVVSKRVDSLYESGRTRSWLKSKCLQRQEFVIGGYTKPAGSRTDFGSLLLGYYEGGRLLYCGHVGTGFTRDSLKQVSRLLEPLRTDRPAFANPPRGSLRQQATWVKPELVAEVEFSQWTEDGILRHPSFKGLREDKSPREITRERPTHISDKTSGIGARARKGKSQPISASHTSKGPMQVAGVTISNPDRVVYPDVGVTKLDLARYYEAVAEWVLPHVVNRPLTLVRCPQGSHKPCFYQRHLTESMPKPLRGVTIEEKGGSGEYVVLDDLKGLVSLVQMGVMEIHPWGSRADDIERPDRLVFDLDPGEGAEWKAVVEGARLVHDYLDHIGLASFLRTSGGKGLHVVVPLRRRSGWDEVRQFTESLALSLVRAFPDRYIATMSKAKRRGKVFIDYLRNQRGATAVASYSTRAKPGATVATPLRWDELSPKITSDQFTVATVPQRLAALKTDPWDGFFSARQSITAKMLAAAKAS
jgi:bifunctional non-homologous end joining protein LigD